MPRMARNATGSEHVRLVCSAHQNTEKAFETLRRGPKHGAPADPLGPTA
jgi:hypothetical protein